MVINEDITIDLWENNAFLERLYFINGIYKSLKYVRENTNYQVYINSDRFGQISAYTSIPSKPTLISAKYTIGKLYDEYDGVDNSTIKEKVKNGFGWGNITTVLRWNNIISKNLFTNLSITYSRYKFKTIEKSYSEEITDSGTNIRDFNSNYYTGINDFAGAFDFNYFPGNL